MPRVRAACRTPLRLRTRQFARYATMLPLMAALIELTACRLATRVPVVTATQFAHADSLQRAFAQGLRDGGSLSPSRQLTGVATFAALPAGVMLSVSTRSVWAVPGTFSGLGLGGFLWARLQLHRRSFAPPDSLRSRYGFESDGMWQQYRLGYAATLQHRQEMNLRLSTGLIATGLLIAALISGAKGP